MEKLEKICIQMVGNEIDLEALVKVLKDLKNYYEMEEETMQVQNLIVVLNQLD